MSNNLTRKMTKYRWTICALLFFATTINYLDRQVLSLLASEIQSEFQWTDNHYGTITAFFSLFYAFCMLFAGRFVDWIGTKKGFLWAIGIWSAGACIHAFCGIATAGILEGNWFVNFHEAEKIIKGVGDTAMVANVSMGLFIFARAVLALGEAGNFPAAIKTTAEYFPKKDRAFATSIFNSGATIGAMIAPVCVIPLAAATSWEWAFLIIGALGFVWMGFWIFMYKKPNENPKVNAEELAYITQDKDEAEVTEDMPEKKIGFLQSFKYKQTWAFAFGKFMTDGVWWFFLFWMPKYLKEQCITGDMTILGINVSPENQLVLALTVLYTIVMISLYGGKLPTIIMNKTGKDPYAARMQAMLIFAFFPLLALLAQPLAGYSYWWAVVIIGLAGAAHQSWSANIFSTIGDMFPKSAIATITGIGGMAGGIGSFLINKSSGVLFDHAGTTNMTFMGFEGKPAGYFIIFCVCAVAYLIGWVVMKALVPKYKPIVID
ncbi:MFS transporter [Paludibacter sp. 221]|uniref:MFS transporter n=1 Tax=Paludibacter sp. 221 TaxID=2302939 RepID=UPI0013D31D1F|nr:MFS transporter [Paludibacter sp. 221]NDV45739.1 MFS transporter [Paludibacter sp. 221]